MSARNQPSNNGRELLTAWLAGATGPADALADARVDLVALIREGIPERELLVGTPFLASKRYLFPAGAGAGKSLGGLVISVDVVAAGGTAAIIDVENGADEYARRLGLILAAREPEVAQACARRLRYYAYPALSLSWGGADWTAALDGCDLVIFDSSRMVLSSVGLGEDKSDEYARFANAFLMPLSRAGVTTFTLDNTGHEERDRARGTAAKADLNEIVYTVKASREFSVDTTGELEFKRTRTRFAETPERLTMTIGGGIYNGPVVADAQAGDGEFRPTALMERGSREVERQPGLNSGELMTLVGSKREHSLKAVSLLVSEGYVRRKPDGRTQRHHSIKPYREAEDPLSDSYSVPGSHPVPTRFPEPAGDMVPTVPSSVGGTGNHSSTGGGQAVPADDDLAELPLATPEQEAIIAAAEAKGLVPWPAHSPQKGWGNTPPIPRPDRMRALNFFGCSSAYDHHRHQDRLPRPRLRRGPSRPRVLRPPLSTVATVAHGRAAAGGGQGRARS